METETTDLEQNQCAKCDKCRRYTYQCNCDKETNLVPRKPKQSYYEKLKDPRWQKRRLEIMQRDKFSCCACLSADKTLNIHHAGYRSGVEPWEYDEFELITLCETCHFHHEYLKRSFQQYFSRVNPEDAAAFLKAVYDAFMRSDESKAFPKTLTPVVKKITEAINSGTFV